MKLEHRVFTKDVRKLSLREVGNIIKYQLRHWVNGDVKIVLWIDEDRYVHSIMVKDGKLQECWQDLQEDFDRAEEMFYVYVDLQHLCNVSRDVREAVKEILLDKFYKGKNENSS